MEILARSLRHTGWDGALLQTYLLNRSRAAEFAEPAGRRRFGFGCIFLGQAIQSLQGFCGD